MSTHNGIEAAFPSQHVNSSGEPWEPSNGLTKREWMATKLAAAIITGGVARGCPGHEWPDAMRDGTRLADKLLVELAK